MPSALKPFGVTTKYGIFVPSFEVANSRTTTMSLERTYATMAFRPGGPTARDQSFGYLAKELRLLRQMADDLAAHRCFRHNPGEMPRAPHALAVEFHHDILGADAGRGSAENTSRCVRFRTKSIARC